MPQYDEKNLLISITDRISALYQLGLINSEEKDRLAQLTKKGIEDDFDSLYQYLGSSENNTPLLDEIRDWIMFQ